MTQKTKPLRLWLAAALLAGCAVNARVDATLALTGDPVSGESLYFNICEECHAADLNGTPEGPSLVILVPRLQDETIIRTIIVGDGEMPAFGEDLLDQEMADILSYLRQEAP